MVVCNFCVEALFCALLRPFAPVCALLRPFAPFCVRAFALFCAHLLSFASLCVFLRLTAFNTTALEAQQRYFSYRAILATVSHNSFVLVFMGYRHNVSRDMLQNGVSQRCGLCETKYQGGVSHHFGGVGISLKKYRTIWGYRSDSIAVSRDVGRLSCESWLAFLILEPSPAISCGFLPCAPRKPHFSAGKCIFSAGKCIFLQESAFFW